MDFKFLKWLSVPMLSVPWPNGEQAMNELRHFGVLALAVNCFLSSSSVSETFAPSRSKE